MLRSSAKQKGILFGLRKDDKQQHYQNHNEVKKLDVDLELNTSCLQRHHLSVEWLQLFTKAHQLPKGSTH